MENLWSQINVLIKNISDCQYTCCAAFSNIGNVEIKKILKIWQIKAKSVWRIGTVLKMARPM